ncbi:hypothetical protein PI126_g20864 [Phytophthora idaei]|nr:hypothetical protein PI126_g20864 [Phytophthora idaei]
MTELLQDFSEGPDESYETYGAVEQYTACQKSNYNVIASGLTSAFQPPKATKHSKTTRSTWIRTRAVVSSTRPNFCRVVI